MGGSPRDQQPGAVGWRGMLRQCVLDAAGVRGRGARDVRQVAEAQDRLGALRPVALPRDRLQRAGQRLKLRHAAGCIPPGQAAGGILGERQHVGSESRTHLGIGWRLLAHEVLDRPQQREARPLWAGRPCQQRPVQQRLDEGQGFRAWLCDSLEVIEGERAHKDRAGGHGCTKVRLEWRPARCDGVAQRAGLVLQEVQAEPLDQPLHRQRAAPRCGELDRQWEAIQLDHEPLHHRVFAGAPCSSALGAGPKHGPTGVGVEAVELEDVTRDSGPSPRRQQHARGRCEGGPALHRDTHLGREPVDGIQHHPGRTTGGQRPTCRCPGIGRGAARQRDAHGRGQRLLHPLDGVDATAVTPDGVPLGGQGARHCGLSDAWRPDHREDAHPAVQAAGQLSEHRLASKEQGQGGHARRVPPNPAQASRSDSAVRSAFAFGGRSRLASVGSFRPQTR
jgi:hypothetical protein